MQSLTLSWRWTLTFSTLHSHRRTAHILSVHIYIQAHDPYPKQFSPCVCEKWHTILSFYMTLHAHTHTPSHTHCTCLSQCSRGATMDHSEKPKMTCSHGARGRESACERGQPPAEDSKRSTAQWQSRRSRSAQRTTELSQPTELLTLYWLLTELDHFVSRVIQKA